MACLCGIYVDENVLPHRSEGNNVRSDRSGVCLKWPTCDQEVSGARASVNTCPKDGLRGRRRLRACPTTGLAGEKCTAGHCGRGVRSERCSGSSSAESRPPERITPYPADPLAGERHVDHWAEKELVIFPPITIGGLIEAILVFSIAPENECIPPITIAVDISRSDGAVGHGCSAGVDASADDGRLCRLSGGEGTYRVNTNQKENAAIAGTKGWGRARESSLLAFLNGVVESAHSLAPAA